MNEMQEIDRLPLQPWMTSPATRAVLEALEAGGSEVRFVGGCVRDALKGFPIKDIDLATPDRPEQVMSLLQLARLKAIPTGIDHGTVTAVSRGEVYEITTLREDVETDGRRAKVAYTDDWVRDAARRDLTINALSCRPDGSLFDPFGGLEDLRCGRVRFVGDAQARVTEDYLRLLRFFRFHATYGVGEMDPEGLAAARLFAPNLAGLSGERVREELLRLLLADDPLPVLRSMLDVGVIQVLLPEVRSDLAVLAALMQVEERSDSLLRLAALLEGNGDAGAGIAERLRLSRAETRRFVVLCSGGRNLSRWSPDAGDDAKAIRQNLYDLGADPVRDLLRLNWARAEDAGSARDRARLDAALAVADAWEMPVFPLRGRDALALGAKAGEKLGEALKRVESWWREADFMPDRDACLEHLKQELSRI
jgi:poly(A) polymerase